MFSFFYLNMTYISGFEAGDYINKYYSYQQILKYCSMPNNFTNNYTISQFINKALLCEYIVELVRWLCTG